jgi:preprotein translocase subunit SecB
MNNLTLRRHFPIGIEYSTSEDIVAQPIELKAEYSIGLGQNQTDPLDWRVMLTVNFSAVSDKKEIAKGKVVFVGYFNVHEAVPAEERPTFVASTGSSVLYGASRELIADITCRSVNRHIILPIVSFADVKIESPFRQETLQVASPPTR